MKYMKLGSKPDAFQEDGSNVRYVASELATDVIVNVGEVKFYLHKFPLISKSNRLQRLVSKASEYTADEVYMHDFPGGPKAFEICAKFCYGMTVTLDAYNVVAARCAAEYLKMTEDVEKGNLIYKIEVFLTSSVLRSWKDSIIVLQTTKYLLPWSEELKVVGRCIDSIASKTCLDPCNVNWSYTYNKKLAASNRIIENQQKLHIVPRDWWVEDICELDVDLYKRAIVAVKSKGRMSPDLIGEALRAYAVRWLPDSLDALVADDYTRRNKSLVETIVWLLPSDKISGCPCSFLLKLLKAALLVGAGDLVMEELMNRISLQLHKATVKDLLVRTRSPDEPAFDVQLVQSLVSRFMILGGSSHNFSHVEKSENKMDEFILGHASLLSLGKLIDGYLVEVASDPNLPLSSFINLSASIPEAARPIHDGLYTAIDIYLKNHPNLTKSEKKKLCGLMNVKKLSTDASIHAAQNDRLPLRVVVQVLFFEQVRASAGSLTTPPNDILHGSARSTVNVEETWPRPVTKECKSLEKQLRSVKIDDDHSNINDKKSNSNGSNRVGGGLLQPSRSRRMFSKLWAGKGQGENNRSSETSGSSQSPPTSVNPEAKSSGSSSRHRRHSIS